MKAESQIKINYLSRLFDWQRFETFVAELYKGSDDVEVSHNVTEHGKSGSKYQVDVLIIQKTKLHSIKILVECKFWQAKVDRHIVNVLAAAIEDLSANKGVIFTTVGYEEGAIHYAKSKNIDIFIVREVKENEWGQPGRHIWFYYQMFNGRIDNLNFINSRFISTTGRKPDTFKLDIPFIKDSENQPQFQLYSFPELKKGDYLTKLLIGIRSQVLTNWTNHFKYILQPDNIERSIYVKTPVVINLDNYHFRCLQNSDGYVLFDGITFDFFQIVTQIKMEFDRAGSSDFILMVENFITKQKNFVAKSKEDGTINLSGPVCNDDDYSIERQAMENGSVVKVMLDYFVDFNIPEDAKIQKTHTITVNVSPPPQS
jgi:hypothetical protein